MSFLSLANIVSPHGSGVYAHCDALSGGDEPRFVSEGGYYIGRLDQETEQAMADLQKEAKYRDADRLIRLAVTIARRSFSLDHPNRQFSDQVVGSVWGSSRGVVHRLYEDMQAAGKGPLRVAASSSPETTLGRLATAVAQDLGLNGPSLCVSSVCTTGLNVLAVAYAFLKAEMADAFLVGAAEASVHPFTVQQLAACRVLASRYSERPYLYRPLGLERDGLLLADGAAVVQLSRTAHEDSQARLLAVTSASERTSSRTSLTQQADALYQAFGQACKLAQVNLNDIDAVIMHGAGTLRGDEAEQACLQRLWPQPMGRPFVTSFKWLLGHCLGASGLQSVCLALGFLKKQQFPYLPYNPIILDASFQEPRHHYRYVAVCGLGFGGNASVALIEHVNG